MISSKKKLLIVPFLSILLSILILPPSQVHAATFNSNQAVDPPTIDGAFDPIEWFWANHYQLNAVDVAGGSSTITVDMWLMNNDTHLYFCIQWPDPDVTLWDGCILFFDEGNTGNWCVNYNNVFAWTWQSASVWSDCYVDLGAGMNIAVDTVTQDGQANGSHDDVSDLWTLEILIPLAMPSAEDLPSEAGSTIGIYFYFDRVSSWFEYPAAGGIGGNGSTVSLKLSSMSVYRIGIPYSFVLVIFSIAVLSMIAVHRKRSQINFLSSRF